MISSTACANRDRGRLDQDVVRYLDEHAASSTPPLRAYTVARARRMYASLLGQLGPKPSHSGAVTLRDESIPAVAHEIDVRRYRPTDRDSKAVVIYLHGGGWSLGDLNAYDGCCGRLAELTRYEVVSVGYRRAPEDPYPAALNDAVAVVRALSAELDDQQKLILAGDSAGAALVAGTVCKLRDDGAQLAHLQVLICPLLDDGLSSASHRQFGKGYLLEREDLAWFWDGYAPPPRDRNDGYLLPLHAPDLAGLPAAIVVTAECDPVCDDGAAYGVGLTGAGVPVRALEYEGLTHNFVLYPGVIRAAASALVEVANEIRGQVAQLPTGKSAPKNGSHDGNKEMV